MIHWSWEDILLFSDGLFILQRSKLTFSKSRLLATFNCKMVTIKRNSVVFRWDIYYSSCFIEILLIQSQVASLNHFGSRIKRSYLHIYGNLVCRLVITIMPSTNCRKFIYCSWAIRVNHAAEHLCCIVILNPFQE